MLRRVSGQIKVALDAEDLDEAESIKEFKIKDISVTIIRIGRVILLENTENSRSVSFDH